MLSSDLASKLAERHPHLRSAEVATLVRTVLDTIAEALARGERLEAGAFGTLVPAALAEEDAQRELDACSSTILAELRALNAELEARL